MIASSVDVYDKVLDHARSVLGQFVSTEQTGTRCFNEEATRDTIYHYSCGVTDFNPLWQDEGYARRSRFGGLIAPPTFTYSIHLPSMGNWLVQMPGEEHWAVIYGGCSWEFLKTIHLGDRFHVTARLVDAQLKSSRAFDQMVVLTSEVQYLNQANELVARALSPQLRYLARQGNADRTAELQGRNQQSHAAARDFSPVEAAFRALETRRGPVPRYWEDTTPGESLPDLPMGEFGVGDIIAWTGGTLRPSRPRPRPGLTVKYTGYHDADAAVSEGVPGAFDNGPLRSAWLSQLITNWMGDWGDLVRLQYTLRGFNVVGDVNTVKGHVTGKRVQDDAGLVDVEVWVENDRGQRTAHGMAVVKLPQRAS